MNPAASPTCLNSRMEILRAMPKFTRELGLAKAAGA
jgi:hypothetical protein